MHYKVYLKLALLIKIYFMLMQMFVVGLQRICGSAVRPKEILIEVKLG